MTTKGSIYNSAKQPTLLFIPQVIVFYSLLNFMFIVYYYFYLLLSTPIKIYLYMYIYVYCCLC